MCEVLLSRIKKHPEMVINQLQKLAPQTLSSLCHTPSHINDSADLRIALEELQAVHDETINKISDSFWKILKTLKRQCWKMPHQIQV